MFKKWRTTGLNKFRHGLAALLAVVLLVGCFPGIAHGEEPSSPYRDVAEEFWGYEAILYVTEKQLMMGVEEGVFAPDLTLSRAMLATVLWRCSGSPEETEAAPFTDLTQDWYQQPIAWAAKTGVVNGMGDGTFAPEASITREQLAVMLYRYTLASGFKAEAAADLGGFLDQEKISSWAVDGMKWVCGTGVMNGIPADGAFLLDPGSSSTRAQAATMIYRYSELEKVTDQPEEPENPDEPEEPVLDPAEYSISVSGFDLEFDPNNDYYLAHPADFKNCKITGYTGYTAFKVTVQQYADYSPYKNTAYSLGDLLKLGNGRAKITINATLKDGTEKEYLIALTDPDAADYAYARARVSSDQNSVKMYKEPDAGSAVLETFVNNARLYYLKTEGEWCLVEQRTTGLQGYIERKELKWNWLEVQTERYDEALAALKAAHPNWTFTFVDVEMTYDEALEEYGASNAEYIDPLNYLMEDKIFAFLNIDVYDEETWNDAGIAAIWVNENAITQAQATEYFNDASASLLMNPYYIACRAALESGYGTSKFAKGTVEGYEGYYNFFGIQCYDSNPTVGASYAKNRNWNSVYRSIVEGANWIKDQYLDQGAITPYFFRYAGFQGKSYMSDPKAPLKEASILKRAFSDPNAKAHFVIPVYSGMPTE